MVLPDLTQLARESPRDELPTLLGRLAEAEAVARLRLAESPLARPDEAQPTIIDAARAAEIAGTTKRWVLERTRGLRFRCDLSQKQPRFVEAEFRGWLAGRWR